MLDVHRLRLLRELDRLGTLAAVARALSYSPSAISQQLSQLEAETGVTLLEPAGRGVRLTTQARILVGHTQAILERLELAEAELRASLTDVGGTLRVASFQSVLLALFPAALTLLAEQHPDLRVEITHEEAEPAFAGLLAHEFDVVLGEEYPGLPQPPVPGVQTQQLALDELLLAVPTHGPHARGVEGGAPVRLAELADVPWIIDPADTDPGQWARALCRSAGFEPDIPFASPDLLLQTHLVEKGHAAAMLPGLLLGTDSNYKMRVSRLPGRPHRRLLTGVRAGASRHPAVRAFRNALKQGLRQTTEHTTDAESA
jgi:DNA-binding transcriptional LysR family regulator